MKILAYINRSSAVSLHRLITPLLLMPDVGVRIRNNIQVEDFETYQPDVFMYARVLPDEAMGTLKELQAKYGFKIAIDVDDYWHLDEHHVLYDLYIQDDFATAQVQHIKDADVIFTTHERLASEIRPFNSNVHVCPNAIPKSGQFAIERDKSELLRLFWQGSDTHKADVALLRTPVNNLNECAHDIQMVMGGYAEGNAEWHSMVMDYTAGLKHQYKLIPFLPIDQYYQAYKHADVCLVPLLNTQFNRSKSNLKLLEAANLGLPVIASAVHPYLEFPGVKYARNSNDWVHWVKKFLKSRKARRECGEEIAEHAMKHFNFEKINIVRKQILEHVASKQKIL